MARWSPNFRCRTRPSRRPCSRPEARDGLGLRHGHRSRRRARPKRARRWSRPRCSASRRANKSLNAFTAVVADRARAKARAIDEARAAGKPLGPLAGVPFAVKNLFDVTGPGDRGRLQDQPRPAAGVARRDADRAAGSAGRDPGRRAQHGRIRLRLHRRELARRAVAQSARPEPHDRRLVRRLGRRGGGRACSDLARLRHQRFDPRAVVVLRHFRAEADLRPAVARAHVSVRRRASIISGRLRAT